MADNLDAENSNGDDFDEYEARRYGYLRAPRVPSPAPDMRIKKKVSIVGSGNW